MTRVLAELMRAWRAWRRPYAPRHCAERSLDTLWRIRLREMAVRRGGLVA